MCSIVFFYISFVCHSHRIRVCSYVTCMSVQFNIILHVIRMSLVYPCIFLCHSYVVHMSFVYHSYVTRISLACVLMSPVSHSYVLVCHPYIICMYSYVIRLSLVCGFTMNSFLLERSYK